ncbi:MAG: hypothetical protein ABIR68_16565, partial [Ilumatobacteraceae bacterium]
VTDTNHDAADVAALCQSLHDRAALLGDEVGIGAGHNPIRIGDQIQTRLNTSDRAAGDQRRVLNSDVWTVAGQHDDGTVAAVNRNRDTTVRITPDYPAEHTVLAYATTSAGAQGRNADTGHAVTAGQ